MTFQSPAEDGVHPDAHVVFELDVDEQGWPPVSSERLWAFSLGDHLYRIDNPPWFVHDLAVGDVVRAVAPNVDSYPVFQEVVERSDHVTVRIICFRDGPLAGDLQKVIDAFAPFGIHCEGAGQYGMVALDIPGDAPLRGIRARLVEGSTNGSWEYDEGRVTSRWLALDRY